LNTFLILVNISWNSNRIITPKYTVCGLNSFARHRGLCTETHSGAHHWTQYTQWFVSKVYYYFFSTGTFFSEMAENIHYYAENSVSINWFYFRTVLYLQNAILISVITFLILKRPLKLSCKIIKLWN